jgi:DNA-binding HxlR family transcriptional regulator
MRFDALQRAVTGVSHRMPTLTLRGLERASARLKARLAAYSARDG